MKVVISVIVAAIWYGLFEYIRGRPSISSRVAFVLSWVSILGALAILVSMVIVIVLR